MKQIWIQNHFHACTIRLLQLLSLIFLLSAGCASLPPAHQAQRLPDGLYHFDAGKAVPKQMANVVWTPKGWRVTLLGDTGGSFMLRPNAEANLEITDDQMDYPGLKRNLGGTGTIPVIGQAAGTLEIWLGSMGPLNRHHREAEWILKKATPAESERYRNRQKKLEERKERAREAGLEI